MSDDDNPIVPAEAETIVGYLRDAPTAIKDSMERPGSVVSIESQKSDASAVSTTSDRNAQWKSNIRTAFAYCEGC
jgi:hypothetical protein